MTVTRWLFALAALAAGLAGAQAPAAGDDRVQALFGLDRFIAGGTVRHTEPVAGDAVAVGADVEVQATIEGDAIVAGGSVRIAPLVGHDLYAAGGKVLVEAHVGRSARLAGGRVEIGSRGQVDGNVSAAGGEIVIRGAVKGYVQAAGGKILVDAAVDGDVLAAGGEIELGPNARIGGKLRYRSGEELRRDPAAQVAGGIERGGLFEGRASEPAPVRARHDHDGGGWIWTAGLMVLAAVLAGALPAASRRVGAELRAKPWWALLLGFLLLFSVPFAILLLAITIIGLPLALLALLAYFALLLVGYVATAVALGDAALGRWGARDAARTGWRVGAALLAVLVLALLGRIPFLGFVVAFAATLAGIGAIVLAATHLVASRQGPPAASV